MSETLQGLCAYYQPTPTGLAFHQSDASKKILIGPFGSGKSVTVCADILYYSMAQAPAPDGCRYTMWGVFRSTYPELETTTRRTILSYMPPGTGQISLGKPMRGMFAFPLPDGTRVQIEMVMIGLNDDNFDSKVRSLDLTGAWINEADGVPIELHDALSGRVGRYPPTTMGGPTWGGMLLDLNMPHIGHPIMAMMNDLKPNWALFKQPPACFKKVSETGVISYELNPDAENLRHLGQRASDDRSIAPGLQYYQNQIDEILVRKEFTKIDRLFCLMDVSRRDGRLVYPMFNADIHVTPGEVEPMPYAPTVGGMDTSGIHPALVVFQLLQGRWTLTDELYGREMGLDDFLETAMLPLLLDRYKDCDIIVSCDPANARDALSAKPPTAHLNERGIRTKTFDQRYNTPKARINGVEQLLNKQLGGMVFGRQCREAINAFSGGYHYPRLRVRGTIDQVYSISPDKNDSSHIANAVEYAALYINMRDRQAASAEQFAGTKARTSHRRVALHRIPR